MNKALLFYFVLVFSLTASAQPSWEGFTATADSLDSEKRFGESLKYRKKSLESAKKSPEHIRKMLNGLYLFSQAEYNFTQTKDSNAKAYILMQNAADSLKKANIAAVRMSKVYRRMAENAFDYMHKLQDAEKYIELALEYLDKDSKKDIVNLIEMMQFSGYLKIISRSYEKGINITEKGIELFDKQNIKDHKLKAKLYYNLALVHNVQFLDIPQKEYQYTLESKKILSKMDNPDIELLVLSYRRLALFEKDYRNFRQAKGYINRAMTLYEKHKDNLRAQLGFKLELALYRAIVVILAESGDEKQMLNHFKKAEYIVQNNQLDEVEKGSYKGILNAITTYYLDVNPNLYTAKKYNDKALAVHLDSSKATYSLESYNQATKINKIALAYARKDYQKTMALISHAEKTSGNHTDKLLLELKAKCLLTLGKTKEANGVISKLLVLFNNKNQGFDFSESNSKNFAHGHIISDAKIITHLAESFRAHYRRHSTEEEKLYWMALVQMNSNIGSTPLNKELKSTFDKIISGLMNAAVVRGFSTEENNKLLSFIETLTSQELINNFLLKREIAGNTQLYKLVEKEQYVRSYITFLKKEYQKSKDENYKQQLFEKELELKKVNEQLSAQYKQSKLFAVPKVDISTLTGKNIIKFKVSGNDLFKARLYNGKLTYQKIANYPVLKLEIENYLIHINNLETPISTLKKQGEALYKKLFTDDFNTRAPTVIIPDDILHYLPFELLVKNNTYLIENHIISYASNFYFLNTKDVTSTSDKRKKVAFFAPEYLGNKQESQLAVRGEPYSLLWAKEEVNQIAKFVPGEVYMGNLASKTKFKSLESDISVLHLAMHSSLNDEDPELSSLIFSNSEQDYEMYISELYGLNFNADLAVLSACKTGVGGFKDGGSLVSMHHAFTAAGIPATIASLWNAPDQSTQKIMIAFYRNLQKGQDKANALQQAKLSYLKNTKDKNLQHPFYWAGFVLSGDESPVQLTANSFWDKYTIIFILLFVAIAIGAVFFIKKGKNKQMLRNF